MAALWISLCRMMTILACGIAVLILFHAVLSPGFSAIQQAAAAAIACASVLIPFVFTRMFESFFFYPSETWYGSVKKDLRPCPSCAENVKLAAKICPHCRAELPPSEPAPDAYKGQL